MAFERRITLPELRHRLCRALEKKQAKPVRSGWRRAAVLLIVYEKDNRPHILLTVRSRSIPLHRGQISFPGGAREGKDKDLVETALRECREEIGVRVERHEVIGQLDPVYTLTSRYIVIPFVALLEEPPTTKPNPAEIDSVLEIPIEDLLDEERFREEMVELEGIPTKQYFFSWRNQTIWGATARILRRFLQVGYGSQIDRSSSRSGNDE